MPSSEKARKRQPASLVSAIRSAPWLSVVKAPASKASQTPNQPRRRLPSQVLNMFLIHQLTYRPVLLVVNLRFPSNGFIARLAPDSPAFLLAGSRQVS
jgi:hypothetical protein